MFGLRLLWRDWRGGELGILSASIVIAVTIVTAISLFSNRLQQSIVAESSFFLAADKVLQTQGPIDDSWLLEAEQKGLRRAQVLNFQSMVMAGSKDSAGEFIPRQMQFASIKAASDSYPLLGELDVSNQAFGSTEKIASGPKAGNVWLDSRLVPLLDIELGDTIQIGEASLIASKVVVNEPDKAGGFSAFGPRVLMNLADITATEIVQPGSRVEYRYLFAGSAEQLEDYGSWLSEQMQPGQRWLGLKDIQPQISKSIERAEQFLLLAGALGVGLAGIAIALAARRYSERHYDYVAMMKSLGATSRRIMSIYINNLLLLAALATAAGCLLGWLIQEGFILILVDLFNISTIPEISARPFLIGAITALVCLLAFAVPPLLVLQGISPLRVIRRDIGTNGVSNAVSVGVGVAGIGLLMFWYSGSLKLTAAVLSGVALTFLIVGTLAWYLLRGGSLVGMQAGSVWRLALASLRRRGLQNAVQSVIFSLSIMLLLMLALVRSSLIEEWQVQLPEGTPNHFLVNVAEHEVDAVEDILASNDLVKEHIYPMVRGRLIEVNRVSARERLKEVRALSADKKTEEPTSENRSSDQTELDRGTNLSWSEELPVGNVLAHGQWWEPGSQKAELSIEMSIAERYGISVGDEVSFQIGSEKLTVVTTSIRQLDWDSMRPNFYMMFPPGLLKQYPATYITSFYLPVEEKMFLNRFLRKFPTITVIEMDSMIKQIRSIINQVSRAIELVLGLIIISGLLVLVASVQASLDSRYQESAILRTLGASRKLVLGSLVIEFSALGLLAGFLAAVSAELSVLGLQEYLLDMEFVIHPWVWLAGPVIGAILIGTAGYVTCRKVINTSPVDVLREL